MKINRLIEITVLLLNRKIITSKELAERFGVSTRTIYRDIEELSAAGVPVYMSKGNGGGISLLENYSVSSAILSKEDKESLILALKTLEATRYPKIKSAIERFSSIFNDDKIEDWVQVDFSQWGSNPNDNDKFINIREAILKRLVINFDYINSLGDTSNRSIEPMKLMYKAQAWYLYGYCRGKKDFRVFRISRIKKLTFTGESYERRETQTTHILEYNELPKNMVTLRLRFKAKALYRAFDDFDNKLIVKNEDNTYDVEVSFPEDEWVYGYILSFGAYVEVLEPAHIKENIVNRMKEAINIYHK